MITPIQVILRTLFFLYQNKINLKSLRTYLIQTTRNQRDIIVLFFL